MRTTNQLRPDMRTYSLCAYRHTLRGGGSHIEHISDLGPEMTQDDTAHSTEMYAVGEA